MKRPAVLLALALSAVPPGLPAQTLDELAREVREAAVGEARINEAREARFLSERDRQLELLAEARSELADENARTEGLRAEYDWQRHDEIWSTLPEGASDESDETHSGNMDEPQENLLYLK